jgi:uncharacterized membrane protein
LCGATGLGFLFLGFASGRMGIVAPLSAVLATALPVALNALTAGLPRNVQFAGFGVALCGIWLLARPEPSSNRRAEIGLAIAAGLGFGLFFITLGQVSAEAALWPLVAGRVASCAVMGAVALAARRPLRLREAPVGLLAVAGVLDAAGNLFFLLALQHGRLDVTAVLGSLYPAVTAILARLTIKERLTRLQMLGVGAALLAIVLITL